MIFVLSTHNCRVKQTECWLYFPTLFCCVFHLINLVVAKSLKDVQNISVVSLFCISVK